MKTRPNAITAILFGALAASGLQLSGCDGTPPAPPVALQSTAASAGHRLPVSLNAVMVALVNDSADPIWLAATRAPQSDKAWSRLERDAYRLEVTGALLATPGTGPMDESWTSQAQWQQFAKQLGATGARAVEAVKARDAAAITKAGDDLVEVCEGCHKVFKPDMPTGKMFGEIRHGGEAAE